VDGNERSAADAGRHVCECRRRRLWLQMDRLPINGGPATAIKTVEGQPLAVAVDTSKGVVTQELKNSPIYERVEQRRSGCPGIGCAGPGLLGDKAAVQPLMDRLNDPDALAGDRAAEALGQLGDTSVAPALIQLLNSDQEAVRARAAYALGLLKDQAAVDLLAEHLRTDRRVRRPAFSRSPGEYWDAGSAERLDHPLADAEITAARHAAMTGLEKVGTKATQPLVASLQFAEPNATQPCCRDARVDQVGRRCAAALAIALKDNDPAVRTQAAWALGEIANPRCAAGTGVRRRAGPRTRQRRPLS